jgi:hypothetical protein
VLSSLNGSPLVDKRQNSATSTPLSVMPRSNSLDSCQDPILSSIPARFDNDNGLIHRQTKVTAGYTTTDDSGTDGDDTPHSPIPNYSQPSYNQANASFSTTSTPDVVNIVFLDLFTSSVVGISKKLCGNTKYSLPVVQGCIDSGFTTRTYPPEYARRKWTANVTNCPVGSGLGS